MGKDAKTLDLKVVSANMKKAAAKLRSQNATISELRAKLGVRRKYASMDSASVPKEVAEDVKQKLLEQNVPEEAAQQACEIVEVATEEAISEAEISKGTEVEVKVENDGENYGETGDEEILDGDTKEILSELATEDDTDEEVKKASLKLLKGAREGKKAFARALIEVVKSAEASVSGGFVTQRRKSASAGMNSSAVQSLQRFADNG